MTLSRERKRPLYEIEGLISFYPHFRTAPPAGAEVPAAMTCPAGCAAPTSASSGCARTPASSSARSPVSGAVTWRPPPPPTRTSVRRSDVQRPERPVRAGGRDYRVLREALAGDRDLGELIEELKESGLRGMGGAGFPTGTKWELVAQAGGHAPSTRSATPTSPSPAPSRTARSSPSSRTSCSRGSCSGCSPAARTRAGSSSATSTAPRRRCCARSSSGCARLGLLGRRPAVSRGDLRLARRLHPRRGDGADRVHGGPPRRAAQQAAVPRRSPACGASRP